MAQWVKHLLRESEDWVGISEPRWCWCSRQYTTVHPASVPHRSRGWEDCRSASLRCAEEQLEAPVSSDLNMHRQHTHATHTIRQCIIYQKIKNYATRNSKGLRVHSRTPQYPCLQGIFPNRLCGYYLVLWINSISFIRWISLHILTTSIIWFKYLFIALKPYTNN